MSPGRFIGFLLLAPTVALAQGPVCNSQTQDTVACFAPAQNLQSTDILSGMQATGPQRSPQSVRVTPAQIVAAGGGGGGGSLTITDGTHTVTPTSNLTVIGATVGGTTPNATLTVSGGGSGISTITDGTHTVTGATSLTVTGATVGGTSPAPTLTVTGGGGGNVSNSGTPASGQIASWVSTTTIQGNTTGTGILTALGVNVGSAGAPVINGGALGTPSSGNGSNLTNIPLGTAVTGILLGANGGTGVANTGKTLTLGGSLTTTGAATPTLAFGASTFTYTFPGATANLGYQVGSITTGHCLQASGTAGGFADAGAACGSGGSVSITSLTPNIVVAPSPITGTGTVSSTVPLNTQTGASYAILTGDNTQLVEMTNASATTMTIAVAGSAGFTSGWGASIMPTLAATTVTPASGTICGLSSISIQPGQLLSIATGSGTNYDCALGLPATVPSGTIASGKNLGLDSGGKIVVATVSGGSSAFSALTSSTNTTAAMVVGTGASIAASGSGTITATAAPVSGLSGAGTGVVTALGNNLSAAGGVTSTIASGTSAMGTSAISSATCATVVTTTATNTATTDVVQWGFNGDPTGVTGYTPVTTGALTIFAYPSANNVNFKVCNLTLASVTPGAITLNWRIAR